MQAFVDVCKKPKERARAGLSQFSCLEVSGGLGGEGLDAAGVTVFAEHVSIQRVAALVIPLWE